MIGLRGTSFVLTSGVKRFKVVPGLQLISSTNAAKASFKNLNVCKQLHTETEGVVNLNCLKNFENLKFPTIDFTPQPTIANNIPLEDKSDGQIPGFATRPLFKALAQNVDLDDIQGFLDSLPNMINDVIENRPHLQGIASEAGDRLRRIFQHGLTPHTQFGAMQTLAAHNFYSSSALNDFQNEELKSKFNQKFTKPNDIHLVYALGWVTELVIFYFMIMDDVVDASELRYGQKTWYRTPNFPRSNSGHMKENVSASAFYDALHLHHAAQTVLKFSFNGHEQYPALLEFLNYVIQSVITGMVLEVEHNNLFLNTGRLCSMDTYCNLRKLQNGPIFSYFPIGSAAILHGVTNPEILKQLEIACLDISLYLAVTRDGMDCYCDLNDMGNDGTDVGNGRITWLLITAVERASTTQKKILQKNTGKSSLDNTKQVIEVYNDLHVPELLRNWQVQFYEKTLENIYNSSPEIPRDYLASICPKHF